MKRSDSMGAGRPPANLLGGRGLGIDLVNQKSFIECRRPGLCGTCRGISWGWL